MKKKKTILFILQKKRNRNWFKNANFWKIAGITLTIISFSCSILAIVFDHYFTKVRYMVPIFVAITAILTFAIFVLNSNNQASRYRLAFTLLYSKLLDYYLKPDDSDKKTAIIDAIKEGEEIIDGVYDSIIHKEEKITHKPVSKENKSDKQN